MLSAVAFVVAALSVAGCAADQSEKDPWAAELASAKDSARSDFEKRVFEDGGISRAEYEEAAQIYIRCLTEAGATVSLIEDGGYYSYEASGDLELYDSMQDECRVGSMELIEPLYVDQLLNPENISAEERIAKCFIEKGVAPSNFTAQDFLDLVIDNPDGLRTANEPGSKWEGYDFDPNTNPDSAKCFE
ncbi:MULTISPECIES: hypothetical protein [unclassified Microbacterium]|uniref:hypothetical protein n=1 Tax=unclassified Microbacterium TaxID=2609290 RepID=UPI003424330D